VKVFLLLVMLAATAHATGPCENTERHYGKPIAFSETDQAFAVPGVQPWCDVVEDGDTYDEKRGEIRFTELRDVKNNVLAVLTESKDKHSELEHVASVKAELAKRGYKPLVAGKCTVSAAFDKAQDLDGWPARALTLVVKAGKTLVTRVPLTRVAKQRAGDVVNVRHVTRKQLVVWTLVPTCAGPPPGYFGPDDGGECYPVDMPVVSVVDDERCL
jgi:hypothetical protein